MRRWPGPRPSSRGRRARSPTTCPSGSMCPRPSGTPSSTASWSPCWAACMPGTRAACPCRPPCRPCSRWPGAGEASRGRREPRPRRAAVNGSPVFAGLTGGMGRLAGAARRGPAWARGADPLGTHRPRAPGSAGRRVGRGVRTAACARGVEADAVVLGGAGGADVEAAASAPRPGPRTSSPPSSPRPWRSSPSPSPRTAWARSPAPASSRPGRRPRHQGQHILFGQVGWAAEASPDAFFLRASVGRAGEEADLQRSDAELVALAVHEVGQALERPLPRLLDAHVQRWGWWAAAVRGRPCRPRRPGEGGNGGPPGSGTGRRGIRGGGHPRLHRQRTRCRGPGGHPPAGHRAARGRMTA